MEAAQEFLDERVASFVGGFAPGREAAAGRLAFWLADGPRSCPAALLDPVAAPATLRFEMRTARVPGTPALVRASMVSRRSPESANPEVSLAQAPPRRWLRFVLCALCLALVTCHS
jgi:hypothetical protein